MFKNDHILCKEWNVHGIINEGWRNSSKFKSLLRTQPLELIPKGPPTIEGWDYFPFGWIGVQNVKERMNECERTHVPHIKSNWNWNWNWVDLFLRKLFGVGANWAEIVVVDQREIKHQGMEMDQITLMGKYSNWNIFIWILIC